SLSEMLGAVLRKIVKCNEALAEPVAATTPTENQRHRSGGDRTVIVANESLENASFTTSAAGPGRGRDALLIGPPQKQRHKTGLVEKARRGQHSDECRITFVIGC